MDEAMMELARRLLASPRWRWMPGMLALRPGAWAEPDSVRVPESLPNGGYPGWHPDLGDFATIGCLLAMYEGARTRFSVPDPVYTLAGAYGLSHRNTINAIINAIINELVTS